MSHTLKPCPNSPNCVSSQSKDIHHFINPIQFNIAPDEAWKIWTNLIQQQRNLISFESDQSLIKAVFTTPIFKFKDQVDCLLDQDSRAIHVRSSSQSGYWDLGVNRKRIERLRTSFIQLIKMHHVV